jgi:hypothetical protein
MSKLLSKGVNHIIADYDLHAQEGIKTLDFHVRKARITKTKFNLLVGIRTELQELGIVDKA